MKFSKSLVAAATALALIGASPAAPAGKAAPVVGAMTESAYAFGASGPVTIYRTTREPDRFVVFISGDGGWNQGVVDMARQLARMDATVVGVDIRHYLKTAQDRKSVV